MPGVRFIVIVSAVLALLISAVGSFSAFAAEPAISELHYAIRPEFDSPRVLVIIRGALAQPAQELVSLKLRMPSKSNMVGAGRISEDGRLLLEETELVVEGGELFVVLKHRGQQFFMEYYWDALGQEPEKAFTLPLGLPHAVGRLNVEVVRPTASEKFVTTPAAEKVKALSGGMEAHDLSWEGVAEGRDPVLVVSYRRTEKAPSINRNASMGLPEGHPPVDAAQGGGKPAGAPTAPPAGMGQGAPAVPAHDQTKLYLGIVLGVLGLVLIVGIVLYAVRRQRLEADAALECAACGEPLEAAYRHCPACGAATGLD